MEVCEFFAGSFEFLVEAGHYGQMPDLVRTNVEALAEDGLQQGSGESLWGL